MIKLILSKKFCNNKKLFMGIEYNKIIEKLNELEEYVSSERFCEDAQKVRNWSGADVVVQEKMSETTRKWLEEQPLVISCQESEAKRRAVITPHSKELSLLFYKLQDVFSNTIDYISKYDFYGSLAASAIDYENNPPERKNKSDLFKTVINQAFMFINDD